MANKGDKYIIEIEEVIEAEKRNLYKVKGFRALVFDDFGLEKLKKYEPCAEVPEIIQGFKELVKLMKAGARILPGQKVDCIGPQGETTECVVVETRPEKCGEGCVIVAQRTVTHYMPFSIPSKAHPYGWNNYEKSTAREYLRTDFGERFTAEDLRHIVPRALPQTNGEKDYFWLLGEDEVDCNDAFEWYQNAENRQMQDTDGDKCSWFLRGAGPSLASGVRGVNADGALSYHSAGSAFGLVAAWVIGDPDILPARAGRKQKLKKYEPDTKAQKVLDGLALIADALKPDFEDDLPY